MAKDQSRRLNPAQRQANMDSYNALLKIAGYEPSNQDYILDKITELYNKVLAQQAIETQIEAELKAARDDASAAEWELHNAVLGVKNQVKAQFGEDSNELQSLGIKKKSDRKKPKAKSKKAE